MTHLKLQKSQKGDITQQHIDKGISLDEHPMHDAHAPTVKTEVSC